MKQLKTHAAKAAQPGFVRIISGKWRGKKLPVADALGLRPTTDRVKETLFNWLMHDTAQSTVLDCFAGSGSLGLEALSRHAAFVTLVEKAPNLAKQLQQHLRQLDASNAEVLNQDCLLWLQRPALRQYNLVLIDPPFRQNLAQPCCAALEQQGWLAENALIYLETEKELTLESIPANWRLLKENIAGQLAYRLWLRG
ncbi:16S rRNA (guanine(966)-N(2))-methyltransferase RsmD [Alishewanella sp. 16-MA]|uniref:Ribosomal RNA small subunit methyltransferase D n=1 Tax=Alishewanella maricola TaxID=2795740 RepID=A0ABS8BZ39_9ALTE|nr:MULTISPECIES: 16S rRNA (guanine(966)-N(2))-methyltransferase RsmD [Gammaproteobacteria]MCB5225323.1 16S rRNA (guanine(966)-N(2))-methyltransferase RsmD [Alishewanella maricola]MCF4008423.1 16S rRNA (guanine(966)-N(2))-methyltransferase RsmD [Rheinheimera sp. UJ63]MDP5036893.1 16S rRNA (guanine(966)-N(2))-methyltransferase RsmD [Alishewanella sp.]MDP5458785.1 16S rRNA (guanine(966)-N(2))-methyltransferase RsmD [Alishewanella sp. SMS8]